VAIVRADIAQRIGDCSPLPRTKKIFIRLLENGVASTPFPAKTPASDRQSPQPTPKTRSTFKKTVRRSARPYRECACSLVAK